MSRLSTKGGKIDLDEARAAFTPDTVLVSVMAVNNETGAVYDIPLLARLVKSLCPNALFHTDAVQAFTKIPSGLWKSADLVSVSSHKIHAPKGVGALFVRKGVRLVPCITGGGQENGRVREPRRCLLSAPWRRPQRTLCGLFPRMRRRWPV